MVVVGIDQSISSTGIVILEDSNIIHHEIIGSDINLDDVSRCESICERVCELINQYDTGKVVCEGLAFSASGDATRKLAGLQFLIISYIKRLTEINNISVVAPTTLKKFATGNGRGNKEDLFESLPNDDKAIVETYLKTKGRYDITDAYWLARYGEDNDS